jgi:hypothetical protein
MATRVTVQAGSFVAAVVVIASAAILRGPIAVADPQDDQFLALLAKNDIPALEGVPSLITEAHNVCRALDAGYTVDDVVKAMLDNAYSADPGERNFDKGRLMRTESRFISSAVGAYCPYDQGKITSIMSNAMPIRSGPAARGAAYTPNAPKSAGALFISLNGRLPEISPTDPPQIPAPKPPDAQTLSPPVPIAAPPPPKQVPRPQQPQSPPQQVVPPPEASAPPPPPEAPPPPPEAPPPPPPPQAPPPPPPEAPPPPPPPEPPKPPPPPPPPPPSSPPGFVRLAP